MNTTDKKNILLGSAIGAIPVIWAALIAAPYMTNRLLEHMDELPGAFRQPFQIRITENSLRTILLFLVIYAKGEKTRMIFKHTYIYLTNDKI